MKENVIQILIVIVFVAGVLWGAHIQAEQKAKLHVPNLVTTADFTAPAMLVDSMDPNQDLVYVTLAVRDRDLYVKAHAEQQKKAKEHAKRK